MQRPQPTLALAGALLVAGLLVVAFRASRSYRVPEQPAASAPAKPPEPARSAEPSPVDAVGSVELEAPTAPSPFVGFDTLPDGRKVPPLPADAPNKVSFGVVVVTYRGAEGASVAAPPKNEAYLRAKRLVDDAKRDFDDAVKKGDHGSLADAGSIPRGVVEPALEYVLFTLKKGEVYGDPVDTPRGYFVVRRTD